MEVLAVLGLFSNLEEAHAGSEALDELGIQPERIRSEPHTGVEGGYIVSAEVDNQNQFESVSGVLMQHGASNIGRQSTTWVKGYRTAQSASTYSERDAGTSIREPLRIPVIEERLKIEKRLVQRGCVQVFQSIEEIPFKERVALRVDRLLVERRESASAPPTESAQANMKTTYELREYAEEPIVVRNPCVIEEVVIGSEVTEHEVEVNDVIRKSHIEVKRIDDLGSTTRNA